ncbi:MAG: penicillin-binding protein activator [Methylophagaceae bacterium]
MNSRINLLLLFVVIFTLSACQPTATIIPVQADSSAVALAEEAEKAGDYLAAAQQYLDLAATSTDQQQALFYFRAASAFWQINQFEQANSSLANVDRSLLSVAKQFDAAILEADLALSQSEAERALAALDPYDINNATLQQQQSILKLEIGAYELTENWLEKANSHIQLATLLADFEREQNQQALWLALMTLTPPSLDLFNPGTPPAVDSGWFALAYAIKSYQNNPDAMIVAMEDWHRNYPNHPANPELYKKSVSTGTQLPQQLNDIAILLPTTGNYATAASAIKQGIVAAHYAAKSNTRLHFINVSTDRDSGTSNVWQQYQKAVALNANLVIGPLDKESIRILAESEPLPVPVLALNRLSNQLQKDNLFQFGLAPEDDAISVANYATGQGYQRAALISPTGNWGNRISSAFTDQWIRNGGILLNSGHYNSSDNDFSSIITPLLGLAASKQRYQSLKQTLGVSAEFEPRRRQDLDFLFLVARPLKARQLLPQLKFHRSGSLPVIATSHAYSGYEDSQQDIDINGLIINDIPWVFHDLASNDPAYIALQNNPSDHFNRYIRLYALGADAYRLISQLNGLSRSENRSFQGATGMLSINEIGHINREMPWAIFSDGKIKPLKNTSQ